MKIETRPIEELEKKLKVKFKQFQFSPEDEKEITKDFDEDFVAIGMVFEYLGKEVFITGIQSPTYDIKDGNFVTYYTPVFHIKPEPDKKEHTKIVKKIKELITETIIKPLESFLLHNDKETIMKLIEVNT